MGIDYSGFAIPKPPPRKRLKARGDRAEAKVKKAVRAECVTRDGHCLIYTRLPGSIAVLLGPCDGESQWAHVGRHRRCFTRGLPPEERHTTAGSGMLCDRHHDAYDAHEFDFELGEQGMNGMVGIRRRAA